MAVLRPNWVLYAAVTLVTLIFTSGLTYFLTPEAFGAALNPLNANRNIGWMAGQSAVESIVSTITSIVGLIPSLFIWRHALARGADTSNSLVYAAVAAIPYLIGFILLMIPLAIGLLLLIVPGLYLYARVGLFGTVMAADESYNMFNAIGKSWEITRDNGFRIVLYYIFLAVIYFLVAMLAVAVVGFGFFGSGASLSDLGVGTLIFAVVIGLPLYVLISLIASVIPVGIYRTLVQDDGVVDVFA